MATKSFNRKKPWNNPLFFLFLVVLLPILIWAVNQQTRPRSKATFIPGVFQTAAYFAADGCLRATLDYYHPELDFSSPTSLKTFTIEGWFKNRNYNDGAEVVPIFVNHINYDAPAGITVELYWNRIRFTLYSHVSDTELESATIYGNTGVGANPTALWTHFAVERDNSQLRLFVNGLEDATPVTFAPYTGPAPGGGNIAIGCQTKTWLIDSQYNPLQVKTTYAPYRTLDEIRVSNIVRYRNSFDPPIYPFTSDFSTLALWHMNTAEINSTSVADASGHGNTLSVSGNIQFIANDMPNAPTYSPTPTISSTPTPTLANTPTPIPDSPTPTVTETPTPIPDSPTPTVTETPTPIVCKATDINKDGIVDPLDISLVINNFFGITPTKRIADVNNDGMVDVLDYSLVVSQMNTSTGPCI